MLDAGIDNVDYKWSDGSTNKTISISVSGIYSVEVTNEGGCSVPDQIVVTVNPLPVLPFGNDTTVCETYRLDALNEGSAFEWSTGATTQQIKITQDGTYSVIITNSYNCSVTDDISIDVLPVPVVEFGEDTMICDGENLVLDAGIEDMKYLWSDGSINQTLTASSEGTYSVTTTDANGCIGYDEVEITVNPLPVIDI